MIENPENNYARFQKVNGVGLNQSAALKLGNHMNTANALPFTPNSFYYNRLGGTQDAYITPAFDLNTTTSVEVTFDYAYATNAENEADITEKLVVLSSRNCGLSWISRKTVSGTELLTAGNYGYNPFTPTSNLMWKTASFSYPLTGQDQLVRFKFLFTASDFSNNLYIDNIRINGVLQSTQNDEIRLSIYPNPLDLNKEDDIHIESDRTIERLTMMNQIGQQMNCMTSDIINPNHWTIRFDQKILPGVYFIQIHTSEGMLTKSLVLLN